MDGLVSVNGKVSPPEDACLPALDRGFLFGDNVFEVFVAFGQRIIEAERHLQRLKESASRMGFGIPWSGDELLFEMEALLQTTNYPKSYLRLVITRGSGLGLQVGDHLRSNRVIYCFPAPLVSNRIYQQGMTLKRKTLPFTERGATAKTGNYLRSINALAKATEEGFDDILWSNSNEEITEASAANIFLIGRQGDLVEIATPPASSGLLLGITRAKIIELLQMSQIPVTERVIYFDELASFDEAFLCSTVKGILPVTKIDQHKLHTLRQNAVFHHIDRLYSTWIESQLGYRVEWNTGAVI